MNRLTIYCTLLFFVGICSCESSQKTVFVVLPDTQSYLESCPEILESQIDWIINNKDKIDGIIHVGDLTQDNHPTEWMLLSKYFAEIEKAGLPYTFSLGNHDLGSAPGKFSDVHNTSMANKYFPHNHLSEKKYWGGSFEDNSIDNHYINIKSGGTEWLIMSLEFGPSDKVLEWANDVIGANKDKLVILNTHAYLYSDSTWLDNGDWWRPQDYGIGKDTTRTVNDGGQIWEKLVSKHPNIIAVVCGHILKTGVGTLISEGKDGNNVYQMLANYQRGVEGSQNGGDGYLRILTFDRKGESIEVETYSTCHQKVHPSPAHNFNFENIDYERYTTR